MKSLYTTVFILSAMTVQAQKDWVFEGEYPQTKKGEQVDTYFDIKVSDPYRWLEDDMAEDTKDWVKRQNKVTNTYLDRIPFRNKIKDRLTELWNYEKYSAPFKEGDYTYYYKNDGLQNQYVLYRQKEGEKSAVFLDPNKFSEDGTTSLAGLSFTKDGSLAAYQISEGGSDWRKVIVLDADTKKIVDDTIRDVKFSGVSWKGNEGFYYSSYDKPEEGSVLSGKTQYHKLYYHKLGTDQKDDKLIFGGEATPRRYVGAGVTEDEKFLVISAANATYGNELYLQSLTDENAPITPLATGFDNEHDILHSDGKYLYILTNKDAPNRQVMRVDAKYPQIENWQTLIPQTGFPLRVSTAGGKLFLHYLKNAVSEVKQYNLRGMEERVIELPGLGTASGFNGKEIDKEIYYSYTSYIYPPTIFKYDIEGGKSEIYKKSGVKFNPDDYESVQVLEDGVSPEGMTVPMIITYKKGVKLDGKNPVLLYGYGGFNISLTPNFSISNLAFMENGGVYVVANLRGGGEYGDEWHNAGVRMNKQNVFDDFINAANYLINSKYTSPEYLAIAGGSNGGLLVGACMTQRPDLFRVCFPAVGVLDMLRYHKFTAGAGWAYDYGTSEESKEMFDYLYGYSPVHNVTKKCYPSTMVTTADHDDRVVPAHSFKFAAELQEKQVCNSPVLIRIATNAGHGAGKPTSMIIEEQADKWAFLFYNMGLTYK